MKLLKLNALVVFITFVCVKESTAAICDAPGFSKAMILKCYSDEKLSLRLLPQANSALELYRSPTLEEGGQIINEVKSLYNLRPALYFDPNSNGGNPKKDFEIGNATFIGSEANVAKTGLVLGIEGNAEFSKTISEGDELKFGFTGFLGKSVKEGFSTDRLRITACNNNDIGNWFFTNFCLSSFKENKELSSSENKQMNFGIKKVYSNNQLGPIGISMNVGHHEDGDNKYASLSLGYEGIVFGRHSWMASATNYNPEYEILTPSWSVATTFAAYIYATPITMSFSRFDYDNGTIFQIPYKQQKHEFSVSVQRNSGNVIQLTYGKTDSNLNYFDDDYIAVNLILNNLRFFNKF